MKRLLLVFLLISGYFTVRAAKIDYVLSMSQPHTHYFEVTINVNENKDAFLDFKMPVWAPGSYLVREFAKNVDWFSAKTSDGKALSWDKTDKNTWRVITKGVKSLSVSYKVYAYELSVRTSFLDASHGFVSSSSVFMYVDKMKNLNGSVQIIPHESFKQISTGMERVFPKNNPNPAGQTFVYDDYDRLADSPIEIGNQEVFTFEAAGVLHEVCMYGKANYNIPDLQRDMAKVVEEATKVCGENPNKRYVFIIHNVTVSSGGLEHLNSTTLEVNRWTYSGSSYVGFLSLVAHEYFHLWNVKRIRPFALGPFDYDHENYTHLLWVMEGFTSYYDELLLKRAGFHDQEAYLRALNGAINSMENRPGTKVQSMAASSFDAWIKAYRPNENSVNTEISYYTKGQVLGALLDMFIIASTDGEKKLDDLMKYLYNEYYKKQKRGFTDMEFVKATSLIAGMNMSDFFEKYVNDVTPIDYAFFLSPLGMEMKKTKAGDEIEMGMRLNSNMTIREVITGGSAYESGLNVNDEIISIDGYRVNYSGFTKMINMKKPGDVAIFLISRDEIMMEIPVKLLPGNQYSYQATVSNQTNETQERLFNVWIN